MTPPKSPELEAVEAVLNRASSFNWKGVTVIAFKCSECLDTGIPQDKEQVYRYGYCRCEAGQSLVFHDKLERELAKDGPDE